MRSCAAAIMISVLQEGWGVARGSVVLPQGGGGIVCSC